MRDKLLRHYRGFGLDVARRSGSSAYQPFDGSRGVIVNDHHTASDYGRGT